jgi:hypothetical protein
MFKRQRFVAFLSAFAVLATALWPLATSLGFAASGEAVPLCHQAGMQVAADSMPMPGMPGEPLAPAKSHCPLCVLVFFAAFAPELAAPPYVALVLRHVEPVVSVPSVRRFVVVLPGSRAPPALLAA